MRIRTSLITVLAILVAACGGDVATETTAAETTTTTEAPTTTTTAPGATTMAEGPPTSPAEISFEDQESDGSTITVASVTLPASGYVVVHANDGGSPGAVIGHSDLLPEGTSADVVVPFDEPITETQTVFPMAHIDANENGEYEFFPPDETIDVPATTSDGEVAVVGGEVTVTGSEESSGATLGVGSTEYGEVVTGPDGLTLYAFTPDDQGEPTCYDSCEANWPPVTGDMTAGEGVDGSLLGTVERTDGSVQVTYDGWPLYRFVGDAAPGDANGQFVNDVWFAMGPDGDPIQEG